MKLLFNSVYSLLGSAVPILVSILTIPLFVSQIGSERYGALAIAWLVLGYFGAADFGIGRAITQRLAAMRGESRAAMARAVWSALTSMAGFGLIGAALLYLFASWYFDGPFEVAEGIRAELLGAVWLLALSSPVVAVNGILSGSLMGMERFKLVSICNSIAQSALLLFPLAVAYLHTTRLEALILAALAARLLGTAILAIGVWQALLRGFRPSVSASELRRLANFGAWIMVTALVGPFMYLADRFIIGVVEDAVAVAAYAIPFQIASRTLLLPIAISQALFPRFAAETAAASRRRCSQFVVFVGLLFAPIIVVLICLAAPLLALWLGDELDPRSVAIAHLILAGLWANAIAQVPSTFIQSRGFPRFTALLHVAELPLYILMLAGLGSTYGLAGFAAAYALRCTIDCIALAARAGSATIDNGKRLVTPFVSILASLYLVSRIDDWASLLALAIGFAAVTSVALAVFMPPEIRTRLCEIPAFSRTLSRLGMTR